MYTLLTRFVSMLASFFFIDLSAIHFPPMTPMNCYTGCSFCVGQVTAPLVSSLVHDKQQRDKVMLPIRLVHRWVDLIMRNRLGSTQTQANVTAGRAVNILVEELSLYGMKEQLRGQHLTLGTCKIYTVAAWRVLHKAFFKTIDGLIEHQNPVRATTSGVRSGLCEATYIGITQAIHQLPVPEEAQSCVVALFPEDSYARGFWQQLVKSGILLAAASVISYIV